MTDLDALLEGIVADPANAVRWLVMADWLEENGEPERAELVRVHRELLRTCTATRETKARKQLHARMMELMRAGVQPCLPTRTLTLPGGVEMRFSFIPPGSFLMGSPESELSRYPNERRHQVTLTKGFWLGQTPVTQAQWRAVMKTNPSDFSGDALPVENVNWDDMQAFFIQFRERTGIAARLPTEAEWEYAARAGTTTPFYWGDELNGTQANCHGEYPYGTETKGPYLEQTSPIGNYTRTSPHPWSLMDVIGNVWEWCDVGVDLLEPTTGARTFRGGSWISNADVCRAANNTSGAAPDFRAFNIGFRLAADLSALA